MSDINDKILNKLDSVIERQVRLETQVEVMKDDISAIREEDRVQNELLAEHIAGVKSNTQRLNNEVEARKEQIQQLSSRLGILEEVPKFLQSFKKLILYLAAVTGAILTITKFMELW